MLAAGCSPELVRTGVPLVRRVARRMSSYLWQSPPESDLACLGMLTLYDAAVRHDPARSAFEPYLVERLRWAMMSDSRLRARRAKLLSSMRPMAVAGAIPQVCARAEPTAPAAEPHEEDEPSEPEADDDGPEQACERSRARALLRRALGELPEQERLVLVRHYFGGERLDALAGELGISKASVTRLHTAGKRRLALRLGRAGPATFSGSAAARS